ncbi:hypothetical protein OROGR_017561 [Orobanche gracilis]
MSVIEFFGKEKGLNKCAMLGANQDFQTTGLFVHFSQCK